MNNQVDLYLQEGCGRCAYFQTPQCKVHNWHDVLVQLRRIALACGLTETLKWSQPCYVISLDDNGKKQANVCIISAFKNYAALSFFKGVLIKDVHNLLIAPGENSHASRQLRFTSTAEVLEQEEQIMHYIFEAIAIEKAGKKVEYYKAHATPMPDELREMLDKDPLFKQAFEALTPGRRRGYLLHFSSAKQAKTRISRIEKSMAAIFNGKGFNER